MTTVLFSTNPLLTAAVVLLGLVVILLLMLLVRSFSQSTRQAAFGRELAEALAAALEKNRNEDIRRSRCRLTPYEAIFSP